MSKIFFKFTLSIGPHKQTSRLQTMCKPKETPLNGSYTALPNSTTDDQTHSTLSLIPTQSHRRKVLRFVILLTLVLCSAAFALGLVLGLTLRPHDIKVYVSEATIKEFDLIGNDTVHCKLEMAMLFKNPNKRASVHYKSIYATSHYEGDEFGSVMLPKFHQGHNSIRAFNPVFEGMSAMSVDWRREEFYKRKEEGFVDVEVKACAWIKYKIGLFETKKRMAFIVCGLNRVALAVNDTRVGGFRGTRCDVNL